MLEITSIKDGVVIDHIEAGKGIKIFNYLNLDKFNNQVALIMNVKSERIGKKDIIKIESYLDIDYTVIALISPNLTINEVKDSVIINKLTPRLKEKVVDVIKCNNPRCITTVENYVQHSFTLINRDNGSYKCDFCDNIMRLSD